MDALAPSSSEQATGGTVADVVYARVRADILFGPLMPGERLRLDEAGRRYGASVGTMRELLNRLASEGLILAEAQRGFEVAPASPSEFREVAALRLLLEGHAMALSFAAGDLDWEARAVAAHHKLAVLEKRVQSGNAEDLTGLRQADREFHQALVAACGSKVLLETYASVHDRYLRYVTIAVTFRGDISIGEHGELVQCALRRDAQRASEILKVHIGSCLDMALADTSPAWASRPKPRREPGRIQDASPPRRSSNKAGMRRG